MGADAAWHAVDVAEVERLFDTGVQGLTTAETHARLQRFGPNQLDEEPPPSPLVVFAGQFRSPLIFILLAALAVTVLLGEHLDAAVIAVVLLLNAVIGFTQERKAEGAVRALMQLVVPHARVVRRGHEQEIDSRLLVPGDMVLLESGMRMPADLRLVSSTALQVDESLLTGESDPVSKRIAPVDPATLLPDRTCMAYTGATVTAGRGAGIVVATGAATELGAIAGLMRDEAVTRTPLQRRMERFGKLIGLVVGAAAVVTFASGVALGESASAMFLVAVALAVSAVPEGLPVAVTITLAVGVRRMARRHAIVRRLAAVETLGSTTVIGSDKTGTLTENRMTVQEIWTPGHDFVLTGGAPNGTFVEHDEPAAIEDERAVHLTLLTGVLTNEADAHWSDDELVTTGDPTEVALLLSALTASVEARDARAAYPLFAEIPFEPTQQYSATVRNRHGTHVVFVKGAPERVIAMCSEMLTDDGPRPIDGRAVTDAARQLAARGRRVLAFAYHPLAQQIEGARFDEPDGLMLVGLQAMSDPPRAGVEDAIAACQDAGIRVVMITGDHIETARAIAEKLGIAEPGHPEPATGAELATLDDEELDRRVERTSVFARVSPEDKLRIVRALQHRGEVVAVTGDGVNDAPALKAAQIGVAMGDKGTDVAREASEMVLADDNFVSIVAAVEEGRVTFDNIRKVTFFLVSTGAAEITAIVVAVWLQWPLILLPAQLLWLNLVTNGLQDVALAFEPAEKGVLRRPPRRSGGVLDRLMWERVVLAGVVMGAGMLALFRWELNASGSLIRAQTVALTTMVVYQVFQAGNSRSETESVFRRSPFSNRFLLIATATALGIHIAALYLPPTQYVLRVEPIGIDAWIRIVAVATTILFAMELHKIFRRRDPGSADATGGPGR